MGLSGCAAFADMLLDAIDRAGAPACVGIDPVAERLPAPLRGGDPVAGIRAFSLGIVDAAAGVAAAVKFQSACYERYGAPGVEALWVAMRRARDAGLVVLLDAKRGDIGISAEHYAAAAAGAGAQAVTVSGYLGPSSVEPFIGAGLGVFVLVRTSNPDSDAVQGAALTDGRSVAAMMADMTAGLGEPHVGLRGYSGVGAVVGATKAADGRALRARMQRQVFLVPGFGAQGGTGDDVRGLLGRRARGTAAGGCGVLVTASRSVIYPVGGDSAGWEGAVRRAAETFRDELVAIVPAK